MALLRRQYDPDAGGEGFLSQRVDDRRVGVLALSKVETMDH